MTSLTSSKIDELEELFFDLMEDELRACGIENGASVYHSARRNVSWYHGGWARELSLYVSQHVSTLSEPFSSVEFLPGMASLPEVQTLEEVSEFVSTVGELARVYWDLPAENDQAHSILWAMARDQGGLAALRDMLRFAKDQTTQQ